VLLVWLLNGLVGTQVTDRYIYVPIGVLLGLAIVDHPCAPHWARIARGAEPFGQQSSTAGPPRQPATRPGAVLGRLR